MTAQRKYMKECIRNENSKEAEKELNKIDEKLNKSMNSHEMMKKNEVDKLKVYNQKLNDIRRRVDTIYLNMENTRNYSMKTTPIRLMTAAKNARSPTLQNSASKVNNCKTYQTIFQQKANMEKTFIKSIAKEIQEKDRKSKIIRKRKKDQVVEMKELNKLKKNNREANFERIQTKQLLYKKRTLERLRIPLKAYPGIAKAFD